LRFFLALVEVAVFCEAVRFAGARADDAVFAGAAFADLVLAGAVLAGALAAGDGASPVFTDGWDWAPAGGKKPGRSRKKIPAKTTTAKRRTQILLTAESWHP
jgi:hypothetical protein